jgi:hypothetical protein
MTTPAPAADAAPDTAQTAAPDPAPDDQQPAQPDADTQADPDADAGDDGAQDDNDSDDEGAQKGKASREAAKWRTRYRESQDSLVTTTAALGMQQDAVVDMLVRATGFDSQLTKLMESSGVEMDSLLDDAGLVDPAKVRDAIETTAQAFGIRPQRGPRPATGQGRPGGQDGEVKWSDVLAAATGRVIRAK